MTSYLKRLQAWQLVFLGLGGLGILFIIRQISDMFSLVSLDGAYQDSITLAISVVVESLPFVLLGIILSIIVQTWLPEGFLMRHLPKWPPLRRACISLMGMFMPVCECGNVPLARGLMIQGFTVPESLVFLLAAPILNPVTIITTHQAFGGDMTILIARLVGGFVIANFIGWLYSKHTNPDSLLTDSFAKMCAEERHAHRDSKLRKSVEIFAREANNIMPALLIGAAVAGLIQGFVPREVLTELGSNPLWSVAAMMALAFIISICSNVDAFFALAFSNTFTTGSLVSFLVFGPLVDVRMLALMKTTYKAKVLMQISVLIALFSFVLGLVVNYAF